jgi:hypothetical protein
MLYMSAFCNFMTNHAIINSDKYFIKELEFVSLLLSHVSGLNLHFSTPSTG